MALIVCTECKAQVSDTAKRCPSCGAKVPRKAGLFTWLFLGFFGFVVFQVASVNTEPDAEAGSGAVVTESEGKIYRRAQGGDKGDYYLISSDQKDGLIKAVSKRVGVDSTGYTMIEMDCKNRRMRTLAYGEGALSEMKPAKTGWFELMQGSSKADLAIYLCKW